jgi:hypothetical protein
MRTGQAVELFAIQCTTCQARLKVNDESVIGQILACPKCGSMVQVVPPVGWKRDSSTDVVPTKTPTLPISASDSTVVKPAPPVKSKAVSAPPALPQQPAVSQRPAAQRQSAASPTAAWAPDAPTKKAPAKVSPAKAVAAAVSPALAAPAPTPTVTAPTIAAASATVVPASRWLSTVARARQDWILWGSGLTAGAVLGTTVWIVLAATGPGDQTVAENAPRVESVAVQSAPPVSVNESAPVSAAAIVTNESQAPVEPVVEPTPADMAREESATPPAEATAKTDDSEPKSDPAPPSAPEKKAAPSIKLDPLPPAASVSAADSQPSGPPSASAEEVTLDEGAAAEPRRPASSAGATSPANRVLSQAEIEERLASALPTVSFVKVPLAQFVDFIADLTNLTITFDERAIKSLDKGRLTPVTVKLVDTTPGDALRSAIVKLGLSYSAHDGRVVISHVKDKPAN